MSLALSIFVSLALLVLLVAVRLWQRGPVSDAEIEAAAEKREVDAVAAYIELYLRALAKGHPEAIERLHDFNVAGYVCVEAQRGNPLALAALKVPAVGRSIRSRPKLKAMLRGVA